MPSREKLAEFTAWCGKHITGDEKGQAQIFLDRLSKPSASPPRWCSGRRRAAVARLFSKRPGSATQRRD
jgi:hypothetical protein